MRHARQVSVKPHGAILKSLSDLVNIGDIDLVRAHKETEHEVGPGDAIFIIEDVSEEFVKLCG